MDLILKTLTDPGCFIYLAGIFLIILGLTIGITPPESRNNLHTGLVIPLFIACGVIHVLRSFDYLAGIGTLFWTHLSLNVLILYCSLELARKNFEIAYNKKSIGPWWHLLWLPILFLLTWQNLTWARFSIVILIFFAKIIAIFISYKATRIVPQQSRLALRAAFFVAALGSIAQLFIDLPFAKDSEGHFIQQFPEAVYLYWLEIALAFVIVYITIKRRYVYEKAQKTHTPSLLSLLSPTVVFFVSIGATIAVLFGSSYLTESLRSKQNLESVNSSLNLKHAISQRLDFAVSSAHLLSENPLTSIFLENPQPELKNLLKHYLLSFANQNPHMLVYFLNSEGIVTVSSEHFPKLENQDLHDREYFISGMKGQKFFDVFHGRFTKTIGFYTGYPVYSRDRKKIVGVITIKSELADIENLLNLNSTPAILTDSSNNNKIIVSNDKRLLDLECGDLLPFLDNGAFPVNSVPFLAKIYKQGGNFTVTAIAYSNWYLMSLHSNKDESVTQVWMLAITLLIIIILYSILFGISRNSESLKATEVAQTNFQHLFDYAPESICVIDAETAEILAINRSMITNFGFEKSPLGGKLDDYIHATNQLNYSIPGSLDVVISECQFKKQNGEVFSAEVTTSFMEFGSKESLLVIIHDISMFKAIEEKLTEAKNAAEEANKMKSRFFANASHEIRTPMTAIIGLSEIAVSVCHNDNQRKIVDLLRISSKSLMSLMNDIFGLSEAESGKLTITNNPFRLNYLLHEVIEYISFHAQRDNRSVNFLQSQALPKWVNSDQDHLRQVIMTVVSSSVHLCQNMKSLVNIDFEKTDPSHGDLVVTISGISKEKREELEIGITNHYANKDNPYKASETRKFLLGFSLNSMIISQMGGCLKLEEQSAIADTLALKVIMPLETIEEQEPQEESLDNFVFYTKGKPINFLIADDNDVNLFLAKSIISRFHGVCECVKDGLEVLAALKKDAYDIILLDIQMPHMDGIETLKEIRNLPSMVSRIPVIAISAFASSEEKDKVIGAGAQTYLAKPYFPKDLVMAIGSIFELDKFLPEKVAMANDEKGAVEEAKYEEAESAEEKMKYGEIQSLLTRIDYEDFKTRLSPKPNTIKQLIEIYNKRHLALDIELDNAINDNNSSKLREVAHSIKGLVGMMSAKESWEIARTIEMQAAEGAIQKAMEGISELRQHLEEINDDLRIIYNNL